MKILRYFIVTVSNCVPCDCVRRSSMDAALFDLHCKYTSVAAMEYGEFPLGKLQMWSIFLALTAVPLTQPSSRRAQKLSATRERALEKVNRSTRHHFQAHKCVYTVCEDKISTKQKWPTCVYDSCRSPIFSPQQICVSQTVTHSFSRCFCSATVGFGVAGIVVVGANVC